MLVRVTHFRGGGSVSLSTVGLVFMNSQDLCLFKLIKRTSLFFVLPATRVHVLIIIQMAWYLDDIHLINLKRKKSRELANTRPCNGRQWEQSELGMGSLVRHVSIN